MQKTRKNNVEKRNDEITFFFFFFDSTKKLVMEKIVFREKINNIREIYIFYP